MGLIIPTYTAKCGLTLENAYMIPNMFYFDAINGMLGFDVSVFIDEEAFLNKKAPIDACVLNGQFPLNVNSFISENIIDLVDDGILTKIQNSAGKTSQECIEHNMTLIPEDGNFWLESWEPQYAQFEGAYKKEENISEG